MESYFEQYCMPDGEWKESHSRDEYVSDSGVIGCRGVGANQFTYYNHMSADSIKRKIGQDIWNRYYKFTVVRNPFDKLISGFSMFEKRKQTYNLKQKIKASSRRLLRKGNPIDRTKGNSEIERFRNWIQLGGNIQDSDKYLIEGEVCIDYFIKFENLNQGIQEVCNQLSLPFTPSRVPEFKKGLRGNKFKISDYYDDETRQIVENNYAWEIENFGYALPK